MRISILGTNGFLSTAIAKYANEKGWYLSMYGLDEPLGHSYDMFEKINLMDANLDCSCLVDSDVIVYAIGAGIQSNLKEGANLIYALNVTTPVSICNKLKELNYRGCFVTFGSYFELGECNLQHPATEQDIINAVAPAPTDYVVSKRTLTRFVTSYKHDFVHWHFILPTIYGVGENSKRLIPYTINAIRTGEKLHYTAGNQVRQYLHVSEVPRLLEMSYDNCLQTGVYNIGGAEIMTIRELVTLIHRCLGKDVLEECFGTENRPDIGMQYLVLDGAYLENVMHFCAEVKIKDIINRYL